MLKILMEGEGESVVITNHETMGLLLDDGMHVGFAVPVCSRCTALTRAHFRRGTCKLLRNVEPGNAPCAWDDCGNLADVVAFLA